MVDKTVHIFGRGALPKTGQTIKYLTGDDGDFEAGSRASPRFVDNGDNTITDMATGLMWIKDPSQLGGIWGTPGSPEPMDWENAVKECLKLKVAGHEDWRLPNIRELHSIVNYSKYSPAIDEPPFTNTRSNNYWSSTSLAGYSDYAWFMDFGDGYISDDDKDAPYYYARPVCGGPHLSLE